MSLAPSANFLRGAAAAMALSGLAWMVLSPHMEGGRDRQLAGRLRIAATIAPAGRPSSAAADATSMPLFAPAPSAGAPAEASSIRILGVSRGPLRQAALVAFDGKPPVWVRPGESVNGVQLLNLGRARAVFVTSGGQKQVGLFDAAQNAAPAPLPTSALMAAVPGPASQPRSNSLGERAEAGDAPAGYRLPPPPAAARSCTTPC